MVIASGAFVCGARAAEPSEFALRDGDTVVFLGDSITAARAYGKIVENFTLLRYPDRKIRFYNAGQGGDTAQGGLKRLAKDVFPRNPTVLIVAYGVNDIGWGLKANDEHKQKYLDGIRGIVNACRERKVRVFICSAAVMGGDPAQGETSYLQQMCDAGMAIARELGEQSIDVQRTMRGIQQRIWDHNKNQVDKPAGQREDISLHTADSVHLTDLGQLAMAYAILKGLGATPDVSSVHINAGDRKIVAADGCQVSDLEFTDGHIRFTRLDQHLPFNQGIFFALNFRFIPIPEEMNRYMLQVENLENGQYELKVDARGVGTFTAQQLSKGVNIASATADVWQPGGPWDAQASVLKELTEARHHLALSALFARAYLNSADNDKPLDPESPDEAIIGLQRQAAQPKPYRFDLHKVERLAKD